MGDMRLLQYLAPLQLDLDRGSHLDADVQPTSLRVGVEVGAAQSLRRVATTGACPQVGTVLVLFRVRLDIYVDRSTVGNSVGRFNQRGDYRLVRACGRHLPCVTDRGGAGPLTCSFCRNIGRVAPAERSQQGGSNKRCSHHCRSPAAVEMYPCELGNLDGVIRDVGCHCKSVLLPLSKETDSLTPDSM